MVNILRLTVAYLNATINVKPETQNRKLEPTGLAKPGETCGLTGTGPGLARQESAGRVFGRFWNRTDPFLRSKPGPLAGYPDPLLTLHKKHIYNLRRFELCHTLHVKMPSQPCMIQSISTTTTSAFSTFGPTSLSLFTTIN